MNPASPHLRDLAERLLAEEDDPSEGTVDPRVVRVCGKLGALLSKLAGAAGYRSLLSRAVALAQAEAPSMRTLHVLPDGSLIGFCEASAQNEREELAHNEVVLVAQLLGLLVTFIGEPITLQLVKEAWPAIDPSISPEPPTP